MESTNNPTPDQLQQARQETNQDIIKRANSAVRKILVILVVLAYTIFVGAGIGWLSVAGTSTIGRDTQINSLYPQGGFPLCAYDAKVYFGPLNFPHYFMKLEVIIANILILGAIGYGLPILSLQRWKKNKRWYVIITALVMILLIVLAILLTPLLNSGQPFTEPGPNELLF